MILLLSPCLSLFFFFQAEDGIRDPLVTGVQTCALPIWASDLDIVRAARAAGAHDFIARLPRGYATPVGERGMQLSGGERQRIALARAFLKDTPLLILDEPTSSVDVKTEAAILEAMDRLMRGRTAFLITHRPSAVVTCDVRLQLEGGRLVEATPSLACQHW